MNSEWSRLEELKGFKLYFPAGDFGFHDRLYCYSDEDETCANCKILHPNLEYGHGIDTVLLVEQEGNIYSPYQYICFGRDNIRHALENNLTLPKSAMVVYSYAFKYYWEMVRGFMEENHFKFAHNWKTQGDATFSRSISVYVGMLVEEQYDQLFKRAQAMMESGLYWLWDKWDKISFPRRMPKPRFRSLREGNAPKALSMNSSL
ncbi:unnamed protein product, partial [Allacma fusca]